jgi:hypothetical protein
MSSEQNLDELLAPDHLSGDEREQVLSSVLFGLERADDRAAAGAPARRPWLRRPWFWALSGAAGAAAAVAVALVLVARPPADRGATGAGDGTTVKGAATSAGRPMIELVCSRGVLARCPRGSTLVFRIDGLRGTGALTAWADPIAGAAGAPGRERIWYFSAEDRTALVDGTAGESLVARKAIAIGPEHADGAYQVHVLLTDRPLARGEALAPSAGGPTVRAEAAVRLEVVP